MLNEYRKNYYKMRKMRKKHFYAEKYKKPFKTGNWPR